MIDDDDLWREYRAGRSEKAFAQIVQRHIDMVHSTARRLVGDSHAADVTQNVFISLARQAGSIRNPRCLGGLLYRTTRFTAARLLRAESRRRQREQLAYEASMLEVNSSNAWQMLAPLIDEAIAALSEKDQDALTLRFFESKTLSEVAVALGISDEAAQKRVERAVGKLRDHLVSRRVVATIPILTATLAANTVQAAPAGLASAVATASCAASAFTAETFFLTLMSTAKAKTALVGLIALAVVSTSVVLIRQQDAKTIPSVSKQEPRSSQPSRSNTTQAITTKSFDEVMTELRRLAAVPNYRLRHAGLLALANAVAPAHISGYAKTDIKAAVEWMKQVPTDELRTVVFGTIAERWAATDPAATAAFAIDLPDAAAKSQTTYTPRDEKEVALRNIIKEWSNKDPQAAVAWISKLPPEQQNHHLASALETWALNNPADAAAYVAAKIPAGDLQITAASHVASAWATADPNTAAEWVIQFPEGALRERAMSGLVAAWATNDFAAAEHWLKSQPAENFPAETIASYAYAASKADPPGAAQWAARLPAGPQKDAILNFVASNWMRVDQAACRAWVNTSPMPAEMKRRWLTP